MKSRQVIRPLVTEKNTYHSAAGVYVFEVHSDFNKIELRQTVQELFSVKVKSVRTAICRGKSKRNKFGLGRVPRWKKAFVQLEQGQKIALFEGA